MKIYSKVKKLTSEFLEKEYGEDFVFLHHTGNMFGIGCLANKPKAIEKIRRLKKRVDDKGFILLVPEVMTPQNKDALSFALYHNVDISQRQRILIEQYWPGNLTVCLPLQDNALFENNIYERISINGSVALRCPDENLLRNFIKNMGQPVISTSINVSEQTPLTDFDDILALDWFDFAILDKKNKSLQSQAEKRYSTIVGFREDKVQCLREGSISCSEIETSYQEPLILFVCTANICRSPMAEYYAKEQFKQKGLPFRTGSAGVFASGYPISSNSQQLLKDDYIDSEHHRSQQIDRHSMRRSWLILTMEPLHKTILLQMFPNHQHKIFTLAEYCDADIDISDPYAKDSNVYEDTYILIKKYIDVLTDKLSKRIR